MFKRILDILVALAGLIVLSPVFLIIAVLVRLKLGAPVLFRQQRPGKDGALFTLLKFRTMLDKVDANGDPLADVERMTEFGGILRKWSLDETPELWNVLKGDMSLVGPRPLLVEYLPRYSATQRRRHDVRPGITGWAQVNGRNSLSWEQKFELDVWYIDNQSVILDFKILFKTLVKVLRRDGISENGQVTMQKFTGSR